MPADDDYSNFYHDASAPHHADNTDHTRSSPTRLTGYDPDFLNRILPPYEPSDFYNPFFTEAPTADHYRPSPSPQAPAFFDHILNPAGLDHGRYSPFAYRPDPPAHDMPPTTRAHPHASERPARLPNGYLDLTGTPDSPPRRRKRESPTPGPSAKRQKREDGTATAARQQSAEPAPVEEVDLTDDKNPVQEVLQKQREDAVKAQAKPKATVTTFNSFNCVICMDNPTDLTATTCGHLFCHTCLMEALIVGENRAGPGEAKRSQCPVCRKTINRTKATDVIPLLLKKGLATQPRKKVGATVPATASKVA